MDQLYKEIVHIVTQKITPEKIILFGSRANKTHSKTSDVDIAIVGDNITDTDMSLIRDAMNHHIHTPLKFDLLHYNRIKKDALRKDIMEQGEILYDAQKN